MIPLWVYWEGIRPVYINRCLRSLEQRCSGAGIEFQLVTPENAEHYLPPKYIGKCFSRLRVPAHRADYLRAALLAMHGGFYFDADTVGLKPPDGLNVACDLLYSTWSLPPRRVLNGYLYARQGSPLVAEWLHEIQITIAKHEPLNWTSLGEGLLTNLVWKYGPTTQELPRDTFLPLDIDKDVRQLFSPGDPAELIKPHSVCFGLNHSWMMYYQSREMLLPLESMRRSDLLIHRLITNYTPNA